MGFKNSPQYHFLLKQGQQALDQCGSSWHGLQWRTNESGHSSTNSGKVLARPTIRQRIRKGYNRYFNKYDQTTNQFSNYYNRFSGLAQGGQQAVQATGNQGRNMPKT